MNPSLANFLFLPNAKSQVTAGRSKYANRWPQSPTKSFTFIHMYWTCAIPVTPTASSTWPMTGDVIYSFV